MIQRGMKSDIAYCDSSQRHTEGLKPTIKILVIKRVLIMPNSGRGVCHLVANESNAIGSRNGFDSIDGRSRPGINGRGHSYGGSDRREGETRRAADTESAVGGIVVHVALPGVGLAPGILMGRDVLSFGVIGRTWIQGGIEVASFHQNPVRCARVIVARVVGCVRWIGAGKRIYPGARPQAVLIRIQTRPIWIRTSHAEMRSSRATRSVATKAASVVFQGKKCVFQPGLADLLEAIIVISSATHSIEILRNDRVVYLWQLKPIERLIAIIAGGRSYTQANLSSATAELIQGR